MVQQKIAEGPPFSDLISYMDVNIMTVKKCSAIAAQWVRENEASLPGYLGAYVGGSAALLSPCS